jgi:uncharacterized protein YndB with AHSA1/START domain
MSDHLAKATTTIQAPPDAVWAVLTDPDRVPEYMLGSKVETDWRRGSAITWSGEWEGKTFQDHGTILDAEPGRLLRMTHFSPMSGQEDKPENYHTVSFELEPDGGATKLVLSQDNNPSIEAMEHSEKNWRTVAEALKKAVERA